MPNLSTGLRNGILSYIASVYEGAADGTLQFRSGARPANADTAAAGVLIAAAVLPDNGFNDPAAGTMAKSADTWEDPLADAAGTIGHARLIIAADANGASTTAVRMDFTVTATGGGGEIEVQNTVVEAGQPVIITGFNLTMPAA
jgi:hypothetical protein